MYMVGQIVSGYSFNVDGEEVLYTGEFQFRTNVPEEYIQDIVIKLADGSLKYINEQDMVRQRQGYIDQAVV